MKIFAVDTSCMIAALCTWHPQNPAAVAEIDRRLDRGEQLTVAAPALAESYSVLTRLPAPHRLSPADAWILVESNFVSGRRVVSLDGESYIALLRQLAAEGVGGGRIYDRVIAACARQAKADTILTFNRRHFDPPPPGMTVVEPAG